jgi:hypothetical protein
MYRELQMRQPQQPVTAPPEGLHQELVILLVLWNQHLYS